MRLTGRPARARAYALRPPLYSSAATLNPIFSRPPLNGAPRRLLAATQLLLLALSLHISDTPAISVRICTMVCDGSTQPSLFSLCARFRSSALLFQASFSFFALPCAVKSEVSLCIVSANDGCGFHSCVCDLYSFGKCSCSRPCRVSFWFSERNSECRLRWIRAPLYSFQSLSAIVLADCSRISQV